MFIKNFRSAVYTENNKLLMEEHNLLKSNI